MPTYQYTCTDCGDAVEAVQKFTDAPLTECVTCGGRLRKVFSPVGIVFKGSGFYRTDSRNGASASAPARDKEKVSSDSPAASSESSSASSNGSAGKPAAKKAETAGASSKSSASEKVA